MIISEISSAGRAQPCQGWGRGFESHISLKILICPGGGIGRHAGLKILWTLKSVWVQVPPRVLFIGQGI